MRLQIPFIRTAFDRLPARAPERSPGLLAPLEALLVEVRDPAAPLPRRLRLLGALGRRVDALFQLRAAELRRAGSGAAGQAARERLRGMLGEAYALLDQSVLPALASRGVRLRRWPGLGPGEQRALSRTFAAEILPLLTPLTVDATHPFPSVASLSLNLAVLVQAPRQAGERYVGIELPPGLPRFLAAASGALVPIEEVIGANLAALLPGLEVVCHHAFRATRDGRPLRSRALGAGPRTRPAVRVESDAAAPRALRVRIAAGLGLDPDDDVDAAAGPLDLASAVALPLARDLAALEPRASGAAAGPDAREAS